jgi:hypothetical protein
MSAYFDGPTGAELLVGPQKNPAYIVCANLMGSDPPPWGGGRVSGFLNARRDVGDVPFSANSSATTPKAGYFCLFTIGRLLARNGLRFDVSPDGSSHKDI